MKCYRKNGSDAEQDAQAEGRNNPSMKCYRKNGSDPPRQPHRVRYTSLNEVLPKER